MSINSDMNQAIIDLDAAVQQHAIASKREAESRKELAAAMNRVNEAQKRVDVLVAELKKLTPRDSDWNRSRGHEVPAAATNFRHDSAYQRGAPSEGKEL